MINNDAAVELVHVVNPSGGSGESYTAGTGITISDQNEIGIDQSVVATKAYVTQEVGTVREVPETSSSDSGKVLGVTDSEGTLGWVANGGIPDMTSQDGKILGAVDNGGTMEAQWISKPVSNVTTSDKQFVVGVNGTGKPITVDCANATAVESSATFTENGSYTTMSNIPCVNFPLAHLDPCSLGSGTATLTIPEDITYDTSNMNINIVGCFYWNESNHSSGPNCTISESILSTGKIKAGTYTISGNNPAASYGYDDGITILVNGSGNSPAWDNFVTAFSEAVQSWTLSYTASEVTGYSITPAVGYTAGSGISIANNTISVDTTVVATQTDLGNVRQVPTSTSADETKVLTVNASGNPVWATAQGGTTYTAGNMISLANDTVAVSTTAGITDIQLVNALPASPVSTVLYLIPQT